MAKIEHLINEIQDKSLREALASEIEELKTKKKFGLVFEKHLPEISTFPSKVIKVGDTVTLKNLKKGKGKQWLVKAIIEEDRVECININSHQEEIISLRELIAVSKFGETVFPALKKIDSVNKSNKKASHVLLEADNYHALQLLEYIYPESIDCIYIDPPYNTGAKDWKYNNNYVDENDGWRHSKWLAFMKRRLSIAKKLLKKDGAMITAIDDNEFAHLWMLLHEIFPNYTHIPVTVQHNPGGTQGDSFSVTHEYLIYTLSKDCKISKLPHYGGETYNLRRWGSTSNRYEGKTTFYPIYLNDNYEITGFGDVVPKDFHPKSQVVKIDGGYEVWPIDQNNIEKKWRYARDTVEGVLDRMFVVPGKDRIEIKLRREDAQPKTVWVDKLYNSEAYGTTLLNNFIDSKFSYPKSLYAVRDAIRGIVKDKKNAVILDFFAGSGTTMHAVSLLNEIDQGNRRCIAVTNNEISENEEKRLTEEGYYPGDSEWEKLGICRSITWPRLRNAISGKDEKGDALEGNYFSAKYLNKYKDRKYYQVSFTNLDLLDTATKKKQLIALLGSDKLPQSAVKSDSKYIISDKHTATIIFDLGYFDEWIKELYEHEGITDVYIVTDSNKRFKEIKEELESKLDSVSEFEEELVPYSKGFEENLEYFKLEFLEKDSVALGNKFKEIFPILWMKSGAQGYLPDIERLNTSEGYIILKENNMAILFEEHKFAKFERELTNIDEVGNVFIVTDSEDSFVEIAEAVRAKNITQLYRDYLDNFSIVQRGED